MYNLSMENIGKKLNFYRRKRNLSLETLGNLILKSKATLSKYEKGDITPDIITVLEICNALDLDITQILEQKISPSVINNPFKSNSLFLYYISNNKIIMSIAEFDEYNGKIDVNFYNDIKKVKDDCAYFYKGTLDCDGEIVYFHLNNRCSDFVKLEYVDIVASIPWNNNFSICKFFLLGLTPNRLACCKKRNNFKKAIIN